MRGPHRVPPDLRYRPSRVFLIVDWIALAVLVLVVFGVLLVEALR